MFIDRELTKLELEQDEYSLGGPITLTAIGGGTFLGALYILLIAAEAERDCKATDAALDTNSDCDYERPRNVAYTGLLVGAGLGTWGVVWLSQRIPPRRALGRRIDALEEEKKYLEYQLHLAPQFGRGHVGLGLSLTF